MLVPCVFLLLFLSYFYPFFFSFDSYFSSLSSLPNLAKRSQIVLLTHHLNSAVIFTDNLAEGVRLWSRTDLGGNCAGLLSDCMTWFVHCWNSGSLLELPIRRELLHLCSVARLTVSDCELLQNRFSYLCLSSQCLDSQEAQWIELELANPRAKAEISWFSSIEQWGC